MNFLAIDFETANYYADSACAIGLVRVEDGAIVDSQTHLIKPPSSWFHFTYLYGISYDDVVDEPAFDSVWAKIKPLFKNIDFLVAHNSGFDENVLRKCCERYGVEYPDIRFKCTVKLSRQLWGIYPTKLNNVCEHFGIPLNHHDAGSDTMACALIMIKALEEGREIS